MTGVTKPFMKTYSDSIRNAFILMTVCLFLGGYASSQAIGANPQPRRTTVAGPGFVQPGNAAARLVVWRIADLGNFVWVDLYVDGVAVANIGYGGTYEGLLPPGRHVLSVLPTPNPKWPTPWAMILDVRSGQTYAFTAMGDSGNLILQPPGAPEFPRGR
jgi:hypothetical protein